MNRRSRILLLGARGQLGVELARSFTGMGEIVVCDRTSVDLAVPEQICAQVRHILPDVILNAAAFTAVEAAESNLDLAWAVNARGPRILAEEARRIGALLVHYSTDYVFDGSKIGPWNEADQVNPLNVYGRSKLAGETAVQEVGGRYLILRTSWIYGPHGKNFMFTMLRLGREHERLDVVSDQRGAPTSSIELANATRDLVIGIHEERFGSVTDWAGLYHLTCSGEVSWHGFAQAIFDRAAAIRSFKAPVLNPIPSSAYSSASKRPLNSILSNEKFNTRFGISLPDWEAALDVVMNSIPSGVWGSLES